MNLYEAYIYTRNSNVQENVYIDNHAKWLHKRMANLKAEGRHKEAEDMLYHAVHRVTMDTDYILKRMDQERISKRKQKNSFLTWMKKLLNLLPK